jgi:NhaP-type Na+/H+ or K+/H+ antiporter
MTQTVAKAPVLTAKPESNIYTLLLIVAILTLGTIIGFVLYSLLSPVPVGYGLEFGALFDPTKLPEPIRPMK